MKIKPEIISFSFASYVSAFDDKPVLYNDWWDYIMDSIGLHEGNVSFKLIIK